MYLSDPIAELAAALAKAQAAFTVPKKSHRATVQTRTGAPYTYHYSTLDELIDATRPALTANGISVLQNVITTDTTIAVSTTILHSSGQRIDFDAVVLPVVGGPQAVGAACTYARRYAMGAALGVAAEEDEDAQTVQGRPLPREPLPAKAVSRLTPPPGVKPAPENESPF